MKFWIVFIIGFFLFASVVFGSSSSMRMRMEMGHYIIVSGGNAGLADGGGNYLLIDGSNNKGSIDGTPP